MLVSKQHTIPKNRYVIISTGSILFDASSRSEACREHLACLIDAASLIPPERIFAVTLESESPWWRPVLAELPASNIVEQPLDRGSGSGVLCAFLQIFRRDPNAELIIATSGADPSVLADCVESLAPLAGADDRALICADARGRITMVMATSSAVLRLYRESQPELLRTMLAQISMTPSEPRLDTFYPFLPAVDFDRDVVRASPSSDHIRPRSRDVASLAHA